MTARLLSILVLWLAISAAAQGESEYAVALAAFEAGKFAECIVALDRLTPAEADRAAAHNLRALALAELGRYAEAFAANQRARALDPNNPNYIYNAGLLLMNQFRYNEAMELFEAAIRRSPGSARLHQGLGETFVGLKRVSDAEREMRAAVALDPQNASGYAGLAQIYYSMGDNRNLASSSRRALELDPDNYLACYYYGKWLIEYGNDAPAGAAAIRKSISLQPRFAEGLKSWGRILELEGKWADAAHSYDAAAALEPGDAQLWYLLYVACTKAGQTAGAQRALTEYRKLNGR